VTDVRTTAPLQPIEVLCGGFPCQDLSVAGKGAGLAGAKSGLFFELARVARKLRPKLIIMENVPAVRKYRTVIEDALHEYGFRWITFSATTAGAPHLRRRVLSGPSRAPVANADRREPQRGGGSDELVRAP